jgi:hypothetical protein
MRIKWLGYKFISQGRKHLYGIFIHDEYRYDYYGEYYSFTYLNDRNFTMYKRYKCNQGITNLIKKKKGEGYKEILLDKLSAKHLDLEQYIESYLTFEKLRNG